MTLADPLFFVAPLVFQGMTVQGSAIASRYVHQRMLDFAALHGIAPVIEKFPMTEKGVTEALDKLASGSMRYRGVLVPESAVVANGT